MYESDTCTEDSEASSRELYGLVHSTIAVMTVPMFHGLVHHLSINDRDRVRLFSYHLVPLMAPCNPLDFDYFNTKLLQGTYEIDDIDEIVTRLYHSLPCLKLRCDQVGMPFVETVSGDPRPSCGIDGVIDTLPTAGYGTSTSVLEVRVALVKQKKGHPMYVSFTQLLTRCFAPPPPRCIPHRLHELI